MKRLTKRIAQLEAKLRFMASQKSFSKSKMFGVVQQILAVEAAIALLEQKQASVDYAQRLTLIHGRKVQGIKKLVSICESLQGKVSHFNDVESAYPELSDRQVVLVFDALTLSKEAEAQYTKLAS